jgi:hypothetical protein
MSDQTFHTFDDLPGTNDPVVAKAAAERIMKRHMLATLREASGKTLSELAESRGVTKAAIHQLENRPLSKISVGSLVGYFQALGYDVDEDWVAHTLTQGLPAHAG